MYVYYMCIIYNNNIFISLSLSIYLSIFKFRGRLRIYFYWNVLCFIVLYNYHIYVVVTFKHKQFLTIDATMSLNFAPRCARQREWQVEREVCLCPFKKNDTG